MPYLRACLQGKPLELIKGLVQIMMVHGNI
jgi:hypothetical protein